jgi:DNA-binding response OmpR family regulator
MQRQFNHSATFRLDPVADAAIDPAGRVIPLTRLEFRLLHMLLTHAGQILTHQELIYALWGDTTNRSARKLLRVNISRLRRKIEPEPHNPRHIITVLNQGYIFYH